MFKVADDSVDETQDVFEEEESGNSAVKRQKITTSTSKNLYHYFLIFKHFNPLQVVLRTITFSLLRSSLLC